MKQFNKTMAVSVLMIALIVWVIGVYTTINVSNSPINVQSYYNHFFLATLFYFIAALFASIFSGLVYTERRKSKLKKFEEYNEI